MAAEILDQYECYVIPWRDENRALKQQLRDARKELLRYESEIAEVCPEDLSLKETMTHIKKEARREAFEKAARIAEKLKRENRLGDGCYVSGCEDVAEALREEGERGLEG